MLYKIGDKLIITDCIHGHKFPIGTTVTVVDIDDYQNGYYFVTTNKEGKGTFIKDSWYVKNNEVKPIDKNYHLIKKGNYSMIIGNTNNHMFQIGQRVKVLKKYISGKALCAGINNKTIVESIVNGDDLMFLDQRVYKNKIAKPAKNMIWRKIKC